jgi:hypothetical protein
LRLFWGFFLNLAPSLFPKIILPIKKVW